MNVNTVLVFSTPLKLFKSNLWESQILTFFLFFYFNAGFICDTVKHNVATQIKLYIFI